MFSVTYGPDVQYAFHSGQNLIPLDLYEKRHGSAKKRHILWSDSLSGSLKCHGTLNLFKGIVPLLLRETPSVKTACAQNVDELALSHNKRRMNFY